MDHTDDTIANVGLFGFTQTGTLKNMKLREVWKVAGFTDSSAFFVGRTFNNDIYNIDCVFDVGTESKGCLNKNGGSICGFPPK